MYIVVAPSFERNATIWSMSWLSHCYHVLEFWFQYTHLLIVYETSLEENSRVTKKDLYNVDLFIHPYWTKGA